MSFRERAAGLKFSRSPTRKRGRHHRQEWPQSSAHALSVANFWDTKVAECCRTGWEPGLSPVWDRVE